MITIISTACAYGVVYAAHFAAAQFAGCGGGTLPGGTCCAAYSYAGFGAALSLFFGGAALTEAMMRQTNSVKMKNSFISMIGLVFMREML